MVTLTTNEQVQKIILYATLLLSLASCKPPENNLQQELQETINTYNGLLADGYRRMDMNHLIQVATPQRARAAYHHMSSLGEGGVKMNSTQLTSDCSQAKQTSPDKAETICKEQWKYQYQAIENNNSTPPISIKYTVRYTLAKKKNKWLVANLAILYSDRNSDADQLSFLKRPANIPIGSAPANGELSPIIDHQTQQPNQQH